LPEGRDDSGLGLHDRIEDSQATGASPGTYRKALLRVVLWALGLAACFGAAGIIFAGHDTLWRIVGTCGATAAGALVLLAASRQLDQGATWVPGLMVISLTVAEYLAALGLIWRFFTHAEEPVGMTMVFVAFTSVPAIGFASVVRRPEAKLLAPVGLLASSMVLVLVMVGTWGGWLGKVRAEHWYEVGLSLAIFSSMVVVCLVGAGTDRRQWRWLGVAAAAAAFPISTYAIIKEIHQTSAFFVCIVSAAAVVGHTNVMVRCPLKPAQRWLLWGTVGAGIVTGAFADLASITRPWQEEMLGRLAGAAAIITGCGTLALLVLAKIHQRPVLVPVTVAEVREITLVCPRCRAKGTLPIGSGKCETCGLIIQVRVQERELEEPDAL